MFLSEFFNTPEGDSYARSTSAPTVTESQRKITAKTDPCWKGYHMVGTKSKGGKQVPNCVPGKKGAMNESEELSHVIQARQLVNQAINDFSKRQEYFDFMRHIREKHGKEYSTRIHQHATKLSEDFNPSDKIELDIPLFIRLLEYAREDAKTDMDLHNLTERAIELSQEGRTLTMSDYDAICGSKE